MASDVVYSASPDDAPKRRNRRPETPLTRDCDDLAYYFEKYVRPVDDEEAQEYPGMPTWRPLDQHGVPDKDYDRYKGVYPAVSVAAGEGHAPTPQTEAAFARAAEARAKIAARARADHHERGLHARWEGWERALQLLTPRQRNAIIFTLIYGLKQAEAGEHMRLTGPTVGYHVDKGLERMVVGFFRPRWKARARANRA